MIIACFNDFITSSGLRYLRHKVEYIPLEFFRNIDNGWVAGRWSEMLGPNHRLTHRGIYFFMNSKNNNSNGRKNNYPLNTMNLGFTRQ
jgi:hypothetical protein